jgi:hypothetical protein
VVTGDAKVVETFDDVEAILTTFITGGLHESPASTLATQIRFNSGIG